MEAYMERQFIIDNKKERDRLKKMVARLTDEELRLVIYKEGWTIAAVLAHLAFWDNYALALLKRWKTDGVSPSPHEWDNINDALFPLTLEIPPRIAAQSAVSSADATDNEVRKSTVKFIKSVEKLNEPYRLNRSIHRKAHLDEIEAFLKTKRL
jgi:hypothetical protein